MEETTPPTFEQRDEFNRKTIADKVITLLESDIEISPLMIDGSWGTGKTEFCHELIHLLSEQDSHQTIYIDAFVADHTDEPLLTVLAEVLKLIPDDEQRNTTIQKVLPAVRFSLKTLAKGAVSHLLRQDAADVVDDFDKEITDAAEAAINASVEALLQDHIKAKESLDTLQKTLSELAEDKPIIIFIDELDRCRPDFAMSMLEIIKHTFAVEGVKFVLVTNSQQLKASINHCYGSAVDAQRYLDKFLKFSFTLSDSFPTPGRRTPKTKAAIEHYSNLLQSSEILAESDLRQSDFFEFVERIIEINQLSLREVETIIRHLEIYNTLASDNGLNNIYPGFRFLRVWGIILFTLQPEIANSVLLGNADAAQLGKLFKERKLPSWNGQYPYPSTHQILLTALVKECKTTNTLLPHEQQNEVEQWENLFNEIFGKRFPPTEGERLSILAEAIQTMALAK